MKNFIAAISFVMLTVVFPGIAHAQGPYNGIWQSTATAAAGQPQTTYIAMYQAGTTLYGIVYQCAITRVLPCTWTDSLVIAIPSGTIATGTAYSVSDYTPFSIYAATLTFTSATAFTLTDISCTAATEPGYVAPPTTGTYASESSACSKTAPFATLSWTKIL